MNRGRENTMNYIFLPISPIPIDGYTVRNVGTPFLVNTSSILFCFTLFRNTRIILQSCQANALTTVLARSDNREASFTLFQLPCCPMNSILPKVPSNLVNLGTPLKNVLRNRPKQVNNQSELFI
eukprot:sb/3475735/